MGKVLDYAIGLVILVLLLGYVLYRICCRRSNNVEAAPVKSEADCNVVITIELIRRDGSWGVYAYDELHRATNGFSKRAKIGEGQFGDVYKAELQNPNRVVAVKKLKRNQERSKKEFIQEINNSGRLIHRNLVRLIGYSYDESRRGKQLIVFEFVPNGTLHKHLYDKNPLSWENRYKIAIGLASGVAYLHHECIESLIHRDIKPRNVMLDRDFTPKLGDFGLARWTKHGEPMGTTDGGGTLGYIAPEVCRGEKASEESDVFSFGIVALEIVTGREPIFKELPPLLRWVWDLNNDKRVLEAVDKRLGTRFKRDEAERVLRVGLLCCHQNPSKRPKMEQVKSLLNGNTPISKKQLKCLEGKFNDVMGRPSNTSTHGSSSNSNSNNNSISTKYYTPAQSESDRDSSRLRPNSCHPRKFTPGTGEGLPNIKE